jgi:hypothetical protein
VSRSDRLERQDSRRALLEAEYEAELLAALNKAAAGSWGLFGHKADRAARSAWDPIVRDLCDRGQEIDRLRNDLGMEPFPLHSEFEASRGPVSPQAPGEPKQARAWLDRIAKSA